MHPICLLASIVCQVVCCLPFSGGERRRPKLCLCFWLFMHTKQINAFLLAIDCQTVSCKEIPEKLSEPMDLIFLFFGIWVRIEKLEVHFNSKSSWVYYMTKKYPLHTSIITSKAAKISTMKEKGMHKKKFENKLLLNFWNNY